MIKTDRKIVFIVVVNAVVLLLAVNAIVAHGRTANTPLYTVRMEQVSSKMNFLPKAVNGFNYTTEKGYSMNYELPRKSGDVVPFDTWEQPWTCYYSTCQETCSTCDGPTCPDTCVDTCDGPTCPAETCDEPTCYVTGCGEKTCRP
ncbi:MAG: hypothetical protein HXS44_03660 [Theionarchaea archaeon]|nr:hypothetical protein [Theionarchaea archaeon]